MKIFWIGQKPYDEGAGEEVVDRKLKAGLIKLGHQIDTYHPLPISRAREALQLSLGRMPYYRARFESAESLRVIRNLSSSYDVVIASWEPFDRLALESPLPTVLLLHNITSSAIRSVFPRNLLARYLARRAARWEARAYAANVHAIATLSVNDQRYVAGLARGTQTEVLYTPPGMPPVLPLADDARFVPEIVLSGTYGWFPKRRDVLAFARDYASAPVEQRVPVFAAGLPAEAEAAISPRPPTGTESSHAIRFGLITDRFESGHKLKTAYYIANNNIVLSYANVMKDFEQIPDAAFFIRKVTDMASIMRHVAEVSAVGPAELRARLAAFKQRCQECFAWDNSARVLSESIARSGGRGHASPAHAVRG
jgi:hypothetical protein